MITADLWEQVVSLPLRDQLDLAERIQATVPRVPAGVLPDNAEALREAIAESRAQAAREPERLMTAEAVVESIRSELHL